MISAGRIVVVSVIFVSPIDLTVDTETYPLAEHVSVDRHP